MDAAPRIITMRCCTCPRCQRASEACAFCDEDATHLVEGRTAMGWCCDNPTCWLWVLQAVEQAERDA
jgi:hypothetical protein